MRAEPEPGGGPAAHHGGAKRHADDAGNEETHARARARAGL